MENTMTFNDAREIAEQVVDSFMLDRDLILTPRGWTDRAGAVGEVIDIISDYYGEVWDELGPMLVHDSSQLSGSEVGGALCFDEADYLEEAA
jgi:hypothetical protein